MEKLLPCPFCGNLDTHTYESGRGYRVECDTYSCDARGPERDSSEAAIKAWNTRCQKSSC